MTSPATPKDDDPPQSQFSRSVCLKNGLTLCLFLPCSICFYFSSNETVGNKNDLYCYVD